MFLKYQILVVLQVLVLGLVKGRLKEYDPCNFEDQIFPEFECRKSCRGVIEAPGGKCVDGLKCCHLTKQISRQEVPEYGYCLLDKVIDEQFECRKLCGDLTEITKGKCATGLKCCFTINPNFGRRVTTAPEVLVEPLFR
ncbi:uncharacterized protein LOC119066969 [Bradysia coprophila]|uniref:uncharacterized protein LOC119066969 n=1 Tax=Bradysia coprophila TaxID=38358 RepID=UPI00187D7E66|nr:uncharacterized protein LOC119066969 [Bradysia coprophila]